MNSLPSIQGLRALQGDERIRRLVLEILGSDRGQNQLSYQQQREILEALPRLQEKQIHELGHQDSICPICFTSLLAILAEEEMAIAMDSPAHPIEELGVTRLSQSWQCGHIFCKRDISRWILDGHDSCPTCRRCLLEPREELEREDGADEPERTDVHAEDAYPLVTLHRLLEELTARFDRQEREEYEEFAGSAHIDLLSNMFRAPMSSERTDDDDRNEYYAMYS
ncbi:hypothetical protein Moror_17471 [Moniliophthora roreri MCA 2997]|uniref:RING-type domain-containing protein n=2 Tax=Moniliophthora roreri TaxID=221103 RepID=V2Z0Y1_MONRO|nr:hypothetical protein Moror_17471 [Moniliophthora roreri MCA 2997]